MIGRAASSYELLDCAQAARLDRAAEAAVGQVEHLRSGSPGGILGGATGRLPGGRRGGSRGVDLLQEQALDGGATASTGASSRHAAPPTVTGTRALARECTPPESGGNLHVVAVYNGRGEQW